MADNSDETAATSATSATSAPNIQHLVATRRMQQAQAQVGEVVDLMRVNVEKVIERDNKLTELDRRAVELHEGASQFQQQTGQLKKRPCWQNRRAWYLAAAVFTAVLLLALILGVTSTRATGVTAGMEEAVGAVEATSAPEHSMMVVPEEGAEEAEAKP